MPTLRQLEYWVTTVEEGSFGRAARRMHVTQPSLSQQVKILEAELGGELLERLPDGIRLTPAGREFLPHARTTVAAAGQAVRAARSAFDLEGGELKIATVRSIAAGTLPDLIGVWRRRYPDTSVRLREFTHHRSAEGAVTGGDADLGIGPPPPDWTGPLRRFGWEELVVVMDRGGEPIGREAVRLEALADRQWVIFDADNGMSQLIVDACRGAAGPFTPRPAVYTSQVETAARLAAAGVGPALIPSNAVPGDLRERVRHCLPAVGRELSAYARAKFSPQAAAFVDLMAEAEWSQPPPGALVIA